MRFKSATLSKISVIKAFGNSMWPILLDGDTLHLKKKRFSRIAINDIVCIRRRNELVTHRVIYKTESYIITKGDNNPNTDGRILPSKIVGSVEQIVRNDITFSHEDLYLFQSTHYYKEIRRIKKKLELESIDYLFLKGLPLHLYLERKHPRRIYADCDILVSKKDYSKLVKILVDSGYKNSIKTSVDGSKRKDNPEVSFFKTSKGFTVMFDVHKEIVFLMSDMGDVNSLYPASYVEKISEDFLGRKTFITLDDETYPILRDEDLFLYLCLHLFHHNFQGAYRYEFITHLLKRKLDYKKILDICEEHKINNFVYVAVIILRKYYSIKFDSYFEQSLIPNRREQSRIQKIASSINIFNEREAGDGGHLKLIYALSPFPIYRKTLFVFNKNVLRRGMWHANRTVKRVLFRSFQ